MSETFKFIASFLVLNFFLIVYVSAEYNCQYKKDGFYTDLEFCHVYWRCNYGVPEEYECPAGTAWNHIELRCDWLDMVDCTRGGTITQKPEETEAPETEEPEEEDSETDEPETDEPESTTTLKSTKKNDKTKTSTEQTHEDKSTDESKQETTAEKIVALGLVAETSPVPTESIISEASSTVAITVAVAAAEPLVGEIISNNNDNLTLDSDSLPLVSESLPMTSQESKSDIISQESQDETLPQTNALVQETSTILASNELLLAETTVIEAVKSSSLPLSSSTKKHKTTKKISSSEERKTFDYDTLCNGLLASTGFVSDPFICNKYLRCNHGVAERFTCASGTLWNSRDKMCTWPSLVDCDDREIFTETELIREESGVSSSSSSSSASNEESESKEASKEASASKLTSSKETSSNEEASDDEQASSTSQEQKPARQQKKNKNRLSSTKSLLTRKKKNGANVRELDVKETSNATTVISTTTTVASTTSSSNISNLCQSVGTYHLPDATNCASYFICTTGKETHSSCPDRQLFNVETAQCEDFQMVFCGSRPVNHADKNQCASKRDGIYPDIERACRIFYQCVSQQKVREATCPSSLKFNSLTGRCDTSANIMAPCGTYNVALGTSGNSNNSASHSYKFLSLKCLATLVATKLALTKFF